MSSPVRWTFIFLIVLASMPACKRDPAAATATLNPTAESLVGTWAEKDGQSREYVFGRDGTFRMTMVPGRCLDGAAKISTVTSGTWSVERDSLVLAVKSSSDPILSGSTMTDQIAKLVPGELVLRSSVASCSGQIVRLVRL
jgi:hypothetical protein